MSWLDKMVNVLNYIEENLDGEISLKTMAEISCYSATTFQRVFQ